MQVLGLTGDIASGKSTVAAMLKERGAVVIDADLLVRELYDDPNFAHKVAVRFSPDVLGKAGQVDRKKLGEVVFRYPAALQQLEALVHPEVALLREEKLKQLRAERKCSVAVLEAVKLIESGQAKGCDAVWCVVSTRDAQLQRLMHNRGLSKESAQARLDIQPSCEDKRASLERSAPGVPLVFIPNEGTLEELALTIECQWQRFMSSSAHKPR